jgi:hypothetical protein
LFDPIRADLAIRLIIQVNTLLMRLNEHVKADRTTINNPKAYVLQSVLKNIKNLKIVNVFVHDI